MYGELWNFDQKKSKNVRYCQKVTFLAFLVMIFKNIAKITKLKKKKKKKKKKLVPREVSEHDFQAILAFSTQNCFFSLSQFFFFFFFFTKVIFGHFLKKSAVYLVKFDIKNGFCDSFPFQKCILLYTSQL